MKAFKCFRLDFRDGYKSLTSINKEKKNLQSSQVGMSCSNVFSLQVLKLRVDIEPITSLHREN